MPVDPPSVLVVDDDFGISFLLQQLLEKEGYVVRTAGDGAEGLELLRQATPDLILLDLDMPHVGGFEVCKRVKETPATRLLPVLILTGREASEARLKAWELGADDFLTKPFSGVEVLARCRSLLRIKRLVDELDSAQAVVYALARAVEAKNPYTHGHSGRVAAYALALARHLGLSDAEQDTLSRGAYLHDIGKISIPDVILNKPAPLTREEYELVKQHPLQGARIIEPLRSVRDTLPLIRWHHERLDGSGYPDGLAGDAIPPLVRVLSVADVYDALSSERPYRHGMPHERCLELLRQEAASGGLDPAFVAAFAGLPAPSAAAAPAARSGS